MHPPTPTATDRMLHQHKGAAVTLERSHVSYYVLTYDLDVYYSESEASSGRESASEFEDYDFPPPPGFGDFVIPLPPGFEGHQHPGFL